MFERNSGPEFSLADEAWMPVVPVGGSAPIMVSLRELFHSTEAYASLGEANPVVRASLMRFLLAMTYLVVDEGSADIAGSRTAAADRFLVSIESTSGFNPEVVDTVLDRWSAGLWLFHPESPFFQDQRLAVDTSMRSPLGPLAITPFLPGDSSSRWGVNIEAAGVMSLDEAARLLVTNWFYTPTGNSSRRRDPRNPSVESKRVLSAAGANFPRLSHFFRVGSDLRSTLAGNISRDLLINGDPEALPAFLRIGNLTLNKEELRPLYSSTLSAATALIVASDPGQTTLTENFLRGSTILDDSYDEPAGRLKEKGIRSDPHTIYLDSDKPAENWPRLSLKGRFTSLPSFCLDFNRAVASDSILSYGVMRPSELVVSRNRAPMSFEIFQLEHGGNASGRLIAGAQTYRADADELSPVTVIDDQALASRRAAEVARVVARLVGESESVRIWLRRALQQTIDRDGADSVVAAANDEMLQESARSVAHAISLVGQHGSDAVGVETIADTYQAWSDTAVDVFERFARSFRHDTASATRYFQQLGILQRHLRSMVSEARSAEPQRS